MLHPVWFPQGCSLRGKRRSLFRQQVVPHGLQEKLFALQALSDQGLGVYDGHQEVPGDEW